MKWLAICLVALVAASEARACSCKRATPEEVFELAHLVFVGTALDSERPNVWVAPGWRLQATTFEVEEVLKDEYAHQDSGRVSLGHREDSCTVSFEPGRKYLVYAWRTDGQLAETSYCARNEVVTDTSESLMRVRAVAADWAPPLAPPAPGERRGYEGTLDATPPLDGARVPWWSIGLNVVLGAALMFALLRRRDHAN